MIRPRDSFVAVEVVTNRRARSTDTACVRFEGVGLISIKSVSCPCYEYR